MPRQRSALAEQLLGTFFKLSARLDIVPITPVGYYYILTVAGQAKAEMTVRR